MEEFQMENRWIRSSEEPFFFHILTYIPMMVHFPILTHDKLLLFENENKKLLFWVWTIQIIIYSIASI